MIAVYKCRYCGKELMRSSVFCLDRKDALEIIEKETGEKDSGFLPVQIPKMISHSGKDHIGIADFEAFVEEEKWYGKDY